MESRFGFDFSRVRIHNDTCADASAQALDAPAPLASTPAHIVFARSQYTPWEASGQKLLAHELAHVVQQSAAGAPRLAPQPAPQAPHRPTPSTTRWTR